MRGVEARAIEEYQMRRHARSLPNYRIFYLPGYSVSLRYSNIRTRNSSLVDA